MKRTVNKVLMFLSLGFASNGHAEEITCKVTGAIKGLVPASLMVSCPQVSSSEELYIDDNAKLKKATFSFSESKETKGAGELVIESPNKGVREYYAARATEPEIAAKLAELNLDPESVVNFVSFTLSDASALYFDWNMKNPVMTLEKLEYQAPPALLVIQGGNTNLCFGSVLFKEETTQVICRAIGENNRTCPSATECMNDFFVEWDLPERTID